MVKDVGHLIKLVVDFPDVDGHNTDEEDSVEREGRK
jgi:hypothetical protein